MVRSLISHQCGMGSIPAQRLTWVSVVLALALLPVFFFGFSGSTRIEDPYKKQLRLMWLPLLIFTIIYRSGGE